MLNVKQSMFYIVVTVAYVWAHATGAANTVHNNCCAAQWKVLNGPQLGRGPGPSPGFSSRGGQKTKARGHILKILYWMYAATRGPNVKWATQISNRGAGHHCTSWRRPCQGPPLGTVLFVQ